MLPFAFEDSVFEEGGGASRAGSPLASHYSARCCEPEVKRAGPGTFVPPDPRVGAGVCDWVGGRTLHSAHALGQAVLQLARRN